MSRSVIKISALIMAVLTVVGCSQKSGAHQNTPREDEAALTKYVSQSGPAASDAFKVADNIQIESSKKKFLTSAQVATLNKYVDNPNMMVRLEVMVALRHAGPEQAQAASAVARKGLTSKDGMTRLYALTALERLNAPDLVPIAKAMLSDQSPSVAPEVQKILKKHGVDH